MREHYDHLNWNDDMQNEFRRKSREGFEGSNLENRLKGESSGETPDEFKSLVLRGLDLMEHSSARHVEGEERNIIRQLKAAIGEMIRVAPPEALPALVESALKAAFFYGIRRGQKGKDDG